MVNFDIYEKHDQQNAFWKKGWVFVEHVFDKYTNLTLKFTRFFTDNIFATGNYNTCNYNTGEISVKIF